MRAAITLAVAALAVGCAAPAAPTYPSWLVLKPGWAEDCQRAGKCIPMTDDDLQELARLLRNQSCSRVSGDDTNRLPWPFPSPRPNPKPQEL